MTNSERSVALAEVTRLGEIIVKAQTRFQRAHPRSRAAYHAQELRARRRYQDFVNKLREQGYFVDGPLTAPFLIESETNEKPASKTDESRPAGPGRLMR